MDQVVLKTDRFILRVPSPSHAETMVSYYRRNRAYLQPFYPTFEPNWFRVGFWRKKLRGHLEDFRSRTSLRCAIFEPRGEIVGVVNFHSMAFYPIYDCLLGYSLDEHAQGKGILAEALAGAIPYVFRHFYMHRVTACYMPRNVRSARVLERLNFKQEGFFRDYLMIDGKWEDHVVATLINEDWKPETL